MAQTLGPENQGEFDNFIEQSVKELSRFALHQEQL
jgi:hypothetical protein